MGRKPFAAIILLAAASLLAAPALADVQAGIDAWSQGDHAAAIREWQGLAAGGDADAQFLLAEAYKQGLGVKLDLAKAEELYGKAAAQGHMQASDVYGLLLFDRGQRTQAMPYVRAAAERGDPRAQYLLGLAHFNGDLAAKDWIRAYALVSLAQQAGLARATPALVKLGKHIAPEQRQQAAALSLELASQAEANLARQLAAAHLRSGTSAAPAARVAGADYARPAVATAVAAPAPVKASGAWHLQLGVFGVAANADALWNKLRTRPELTGHPRINVPAGGAIKLQAGGFVSKQAARAACSRLAGAGVSCLAVAR